jgi:sarcosine oxidase/L-pipecolate oxidase
LLELTQGWANAAQATYRVASLAQTKGVRFHSGDAGNVTSLLYNTAKTKVTGITTKSGSTFYADKVILCTGSWTNSLIDTQGQLVSKGHCLAHIQLTPAEHERYRNIPVFDDSKWDVYYFPPFEENGVMKIAGLGSGYTIHNEPRTQSDFPDDGIPFEAEEHLRRGMRASIPSLADHEMFDLRVCWCVDTPDMHFLITPHPTDGLYIATGGMPT